MLHIKNIDVALADICWVFPTAFPAELSGRLTKSVWTAFINDLNWPGKCAVERQQWRICIVWALALGVMPFFFAFMRIPTFLIAALVYIIFVYIVVFLMRQLRKTQYNTQGAADIIVRFWNTGEKFRTAGISAAVHSNQKDFEVENWLVINLEACSASKGEASLRPVAYG